MGSSVLHEIDNLLNPERQAEAWRVLRAYIQQLDYRGMPRLLANIRDGQEHESPNEPAISLYEDIARQHGKGVIPYISEIMENLMRVLAWSPTLSLQKICSKVVSALARYTFDPTSHSSQKEGIIRNITRPLLDTLLGSVQSEGSALCFMELMDTEAWKHAPDDVVNDACLRVTSALQEDDTKTPTHLRLAASLASSNSLILEAYCRSLLEVAIDIMNSPSVNWQQRLHAVLMIDSLVNHVIMETSDLERLVGNLERWKSDRMPAVRDAVLETLHVAKSGLLDNISVFSEGTPHGSHIWSSSSVPMDMPYGSNSRFSPQSLPPRLTSGSVQRRLYDRDSASKSLFVDDIPESGHCLAETSKDNDYRSPGSCVSRTRLSCHRREFSAPTSLLHFEGHAGSSVSLKNGMVGGREDGEFVSEWENYGKQAEEENGRSYHRRSRTSDSQFSFGHCYLESQFPTGEDEDYAFQDKIPGSDSYQSTKGPFLPNTVRSKNVREHYTGIHCGCTGLGQCSANDERMTKSCVGKVLLDQLNEVATDGLLDNCNGEEEGANSPAFSDMLRNSDSLSSSTEFKDIPEGINTDEWDSCTAQKSSKLRKGWNVLRTGWAKTLHVAETLLKGSLFVVMAVPVTMVAVKLYSMHADYRHILVPT